MNNIPLRSVFLTAEWRKLIMANYPVSPSVLQAYLPAKTELDTWKGQPYVSLVGFMFREVKVKGFSVPFHTTFPEVNLRFYVRFKEGSEWKRGVVFISEIVPKRVITWVANTLFREHYISLPMRNTNKTDGELLGCAYQWKYKGSWNELAVNANALPHPLVPGSPEEFITEHFWGYARVGKQKTAEYQVAHPRWDTYAIRDYKIGCDFGILYGDGFSWLASQAPQSIFMAEGSPIKVYTKSII
jgi:uncharacterized protein